MTARVHVAIAVVERDDHFLVGCRPRGTPLAGYAEFPGGKIRPGELPADAARRECLEETGQDIEIVRPLEIVSHQYDHGAVTLHFFLCRIRHDVGNLSSPFAWVARARLREFRFPPANASVLEVLLKHDAGKC